MSDDPSPDRAREKTPESYAAYVDPELTEESGDVHRM